MNYKLQNNFDTDIFLELTQRENCLNYYKLLENFNIDCFSTTKYEVSFVSK